MVAACAEWRLPARKDWALMAVRQALGQNMVLRSLCNSCMSATWSIHADYSGEINVTLFKET